jgi:hypothetical protein
MWYVLWSQLLERLRWKHHLSLGVQVQPGQQNEILSQKEEGRKKKEKEEEEKKEEKEKEEEEEKEKEEEEEGRGGEEEEVSHHTMVPLLSSLRYLKSPIMLSAYIPVINHFWIIAFILALTHSYVRPQNNTEGKREQPREALSE